jgi:hypothetical protein
MLYPQETTQKSLKPMVIPPSASGYQITTFFCPTFGKRAVNISYRF